MKNTSFKNILIAPLNWGLGHATRCIPIIKQLEERGFVPIIASDGMALILLKMEFPHLLALELPSYQIEYPTNGKDFKWKIIKNAPKMGVAIKNEKKLVKEWTLQYNLVGIISDNRLGVFNKNVPSIYITHQLNLLTGNTTWLSTKIHQFVINKFNECWVPDTSELVNLSGRLGHLKQSNSGIKYIGALSRFKKISIPKQFDLMVLLSGPEPQRTVLEVKLMNEIKCFKGAVVFIKGIVQEQQVVEQQEHVLVYNFMNALELEEAMNASNLVLCRSGYTTVMDLSKLEKKAFFIPTPGQFEQEYLARKFNAQKIAPFSNQDAFKIEMLKRTEKFSGFLNFTDFKVDWKQLFCLFERE